MSNDFSTLKLNPASEKIVLARMKPGRDISFDLTQVGATNIYTMTFPFSTLTGVEVNGITYTLVTGTPALNQYSFDASTNLFSIYLGASLGFYQAVGAIVAFYYLYYTNDRHRITHSDPENTATEKVSWEPRINGFPSFKMDQQDVIDGILTIGNSSLDLINTDSDFQQYCTNYDSFSRKEIKIWQALDSVENVKKLFTGFCSDISIGKNVSISIDNQFSALNDNFYSNGTYLESTYNLATYPNVHPDDTDKAIPKLYFKCSPTTDNDVVAPPYLLPYGSLLPFYQFSEGYYLTNISYNPNRSKTVNRTWAACVASASSSNHSITASSVNATIPNQVYRTNVADATLFRPGDNLLVNNNPGYSVYDVDFTNNRINVYTRFASVTTLSNGDAIIRPAISVVQVFDEDDKSVACLSCGTSTNRSVNDYRLATDANGVYNIILNDNFEDNYTSAEFYTGGGLAAGARILYRVYNHDNLDHGTIVQEIIESVGLTVNASSITTANATTFKAYFSNPYKGSNSFSSARSMLQDLLTSTFGMLSINSDLEISYNLIQAPSSTEEIDENDFLMDSLEQQIDYKDIYSDLEFTQNHRELVYLDINHTVQDTGIESPVNIGKVAFLHGINRSKTIKYITANMTNSKTRIQNVLGNRRAILGFRTKGRDFETSLGDDFILVSNKVISGSGQKTIKTFSIERLPNETRLKGIDLVGL